MIACVMSIASINSIPSKSSQKWKNCKSETTSVIIRYGYNFSFRWYQRILYTCLQMWLLSPFESPFWLFSAPYVCLLSRKWIKYCTENLLVFLNTKNLNPLLIFREYFVFQFWFWGRDSSLTQKLNARDLFCQPPLYRRFCHLDAPAQVLSWAEGSAMCQRCWQCKVPGLQTVTGQLTGGLASQAADTRSTPATVILQNWSWTLLWQQSPLDIHKSAVVV